jgi:putative ABC transport system ATP-binding protein
MTRPTSGRIELAGRDVTRLPEDDLALLRRSTIGIVFQSNHLVRGTSAIDNVMLPGVPCTEMNGNLRRDAKALLERFGLGQRSDERVERLSGGEQQRVAIARALINDPQVFLADEPTAHLDEEATRRFLDFVVDLRARGKTVVVASHDRLLAESSVFGEVFELSQGHLV